MNKQPIQTKTSVRMISLGCPKNLVDSEVMAGFLNKDQFHLVPEGQPADVGIVNTCGFIESAKQESIETILELANEKKSGKLKFLVVTGCLSQRYQEELPKLLPEVDAFLGTGDFGRLPGIIRQKMGGSNIRNYIRYPEELPLADGPRIYTTPSYTRFIKISEGCSHTCSFCTIPLMRGGLKSRPINDVFCEIEKGVFEGVKEFNLIAQDLNEYGRDLKERSSLYELLMKLGDLKGDFWVRPLYMYPLWFPDRLIRLIACHPHVVPYVDIPLQHIDDRLLKSMRRGSSSGYIYRLLELLRKHIPGIILRTTFIVGYPGETETEFKKLENFVRETKFDRLGVFTYSDEESTLAATLGEKVPKEVKQERQDRLMQLQQKISYKKNQSYVGKTMRVLYEGTPKPLDPLPCHADGLGRFFGQAPEIDGQVLIQSKNSQNGFLKGQFVDVYIHKALEYDLVAGTSKNRPSTSLPASPASSR